MVADIAPVSYTRRHDPVIDGLTEVNRTKLTSRRDADQLLSRYVTEPGSTCLSVKSLTRNEKGYFQLKFNLASIAKNYEQLIQGPDGTPFKGPTLFIKGAESPIFRKNIAILHSGYPEHPIEDNCRHRALASRRETGHI